MVPVFTAARCMMQYVETLFHQHWVPLGLVCQHSSEHGFSPLLFSSSVSGMRQLLPTSLSFSGVRESLGDQDDVACIFIYAGAGERAARFVRTSL